MHIAVSHTGEQITFIFSREELGNAEDVLRYVTEGCNNSGIQTPDDDFLARIRDQRKRKLDCIITLSLEQFKEFCLVFVRTLANLSEDQGLDTTQMIHLLQELTDGQYQPDLVN